MVYDWSDDYRGGFAATREGTQIGDNQPLDLLLGHGQLVHIGQFAG